MQETWSGIWGAVHFLSIHNVNIFVYSAGTYCRQYNLSYFRLKQIMYLNLSVHLFITASKIGPRMLLDFYIFRFFSVAAILQIACLIIIWTGLNIKIGIIQKLYEWPSWYFPKMILLMGNHFGKRTAWSLIYFLSYAYFDV